MTLLQALLTEARKCGRLEEQLKDAEQRLARVSSTMEVLAVEKLKLEDALASHKDQITALVSELRTARGK